MLLATGGTIACTNGNHGLEPTLHGRNLLEAIQAELPCAVDAQDVFLMDSSNMQPEEWSALARAVDGALQSYDGVVITHGTDTMAYTAAALSFMLAGVGKPVILTGSQLPLAHPLTDGRLNLLRAIHAAMADISGVYVCFDNQLISGVRCVKTHTSSMNAFSSVNEPPAGYFDVEGLHIDHPQPYLPLEQPYRLRDGIDPRVFLLKLVPGTDPRIFDMLMKMGVRGIVIEAFGAGGVQFIRRDLTKKLNEVIRNGVSVVVCSQCLYERSDFSLYEVGQRALEQGVIQTFDMTSEAAVTKLMWALGRTQDRMEVAKWFATNLVGEISLNYHK